MMCALSCHIAHSMSELAPWRDRWNALADSLRLPLVRYEWFLAAEAHLAGKAMVRILYLLDVEGDLAAGIALELRQNEAGHREYQILGMPRLYEPSALLYRDDAARCSLLRALAGLDRPTVLARIWQHGSGDLADDAGFWLSRRALWFSKRSAPSQYLELADDYPAYIAQLPSQRRYDLRRAYKRADTSGSLAARFVRPSPPDLDEVLGLAFAVESRSWKGDSGCSVLANEDLRRFFFDMLRGYAPDGRVVIALLNVGTALVAAQVCLLSHERLWILKIGYDAAFHKLSPGLILMSEVIKHAYDIGLQGIEFLGSAESWVDAWRPSRRQYRLMAAYPYNVGSLTTLGRHVAGSMLRRMRRMQPVRG